MEMFLLLLIILTAAGYLINKVWRGLQGETSCNCGNCSGSCQKFSSESCCCDSVKTK